MDSKSGGKRCKCKKSKCLKLYCECFAAGFFCDETCACKDCFNSRDYDDYVEDARKQIQLRNSYAFSSKIDCLVAAPRKFDVEDGDQVKLVTGKHRRGCNCKKSMCQKKYCECYQAKVGCCDECRCQGCKNAFGKKEDYNLFTDETVENRMQSTGSEFDLHEFSNHQNSTPVTQFQHLGHEYEPPRIGRYINSPGSVDSDMITGTNIGNFDPVCLDQQLYQNAFTDQFTPPDTTAHFNSMMNIPTRTLLVFGDQNCSPASGSLNGSPMTPLTAFNGPEVVNSHENLQPCNDGVVHMWTSPGNN